MADPADVTVLIPTYNEAETIASVLEGFQSQGYDTILVVDGGSTDGTVETAEDHGADVIHQTGTGKGQAVREGLKQIDTEIVVLVDGDATYRPDQVDRLLEPIQDGRYEHVIGNRFADLQPGAMTRLNHFGNRLMTRAFGLIHGQSFGDILSGYRAFTLESVERFNLKTEGFGIETELSVACVKHGIPTTSVPITYQPRPEDSETNLHPIRDGGVIMLTLYRLAKTTNPMFYFGSLGGVSLLGGFLVAAYVGYEWFVRGISHEILAVVAGVALLLGVQLLMLGLISDLIVNLHNDLLRRIERED